MGAVGRTEQAVLASGLATVLELHREEIAVSWAERVHGVPDSRYGGQPLEELCASAMRGLGAMVDALATGSYTALESYLSDVCLARLQMGFGIAEVIEALLLCKNAALPLIRQAYPLDSPTPWALISELDACLRWMVGRFGELFATETRRILQKQQARTAMMLDIVQAASSSLELDEVLSRVAKGIASAAGVDYCVFFLLDEEQGILIPRFEMSVRPWQSTASRLGFPLPLPPRPIATFDALLPQLAEQREPLACYDAQTDPRFNHEAVRRWGFKSVLAVPFVVKGRVVAVAWAVTFEDHRAFTEEEVKPVWGIANAVGLAIENARLHAQVHHLAALEERDRLAREIHDNLAQALGMLKLRSSLALDLLTDDRVEQAQANLCDMKDIAAEAYTDAREAMLGLRSVASAGTDFLPSLRKYLSRYRTSHGVDARLQADDRVTAGLTVQAASQVMRIIQEALTNVRKHAKAKGAWVRIEPEGDGIRVTVEDDGQGFDPSQPATDAPRGFGLQVMEERAESVGGWLEVDAHQGRGTRIVAWVPLSPER
jgi:signal transduction histidine kinase